MASRMASLPRKEKETLDTPPEDQTAPGSGFDKTGSFKGNLWHSYCALRCLWQRENVGVKKYVVGGESRFLQLIFYKHACRCLHVFDVSAWPFSSKAMTMAAAP